MVCMCLYIKGETQCGIFGLLRAIFVSWWNNCPLSSSKVITALAREVPVNVFLSLLPSASVSTDSSSADVTNLWWLRCRVTARCGEWFVWVVIDLGVFELFKWSNYWFCLLFFPLCNLFCHPLPLPPHPSSLCRLCMFSPEFSASHLLFIWEFLISPRYSHHHFGVL